MAAATESLFALEVLVEEVLVAAPGPTMRPVVALRLLDFPTLLLHPAATPPLQPGRAFPFGRGKRCLFRWRRNSLCTGLCRRPLRALLLAFPIELAPGPPRLLGSCEVSLAPAAVELLQRPEAPASCSRRGRFMLRDAAGRPVGELVLGYRLTSLQGSEEQEPAPASTTSPHSATLPASSPEPRAEEEDEELEGNIFCPPMLYYSRKAAEPHLPPAAAATGQREHIKALRPQDKDKGQSPPRPSAGHSLLHPTSPQQLPHTLGQLPLLNALLAELSVLTRCIMPVAAHPNHEWVYQARGSSGMASESPSPGCSCPLHPAQVPVRPPGNSEAGHPLIKQDQQNDTSPESFQPGKGPKKAVPQGETGAGRNCETKENRPPRKKLLYGLTNTLRLRLQQTNPGKLEIHERREQYRKKQMEVLKEKSALPKRKLLRNAGDQRAVSYRQCSKENSSKKNNQFHKTVETLLQNDVLPVRGDVSPDLQKWATASLLKDNEIASHGDPCKGTTSPLTEKTVLKSSGKEKSAKTQLPEVFPSDADAQRSNEEAIYLIHRKTTEYDDVSVASDSKPSPSRSIENGSEFIYSDDFVASPENTVYSEDFTSAEHMGRDSEALDSTPELESQKQGWSDTELKSSRSTVLSQRSESASGPLPASSASFPGQSQKRNHDFKTSQRTSGESVDSLNLAQMELSLLGEEQEAQQISKDDNKGDHIKQVSTLRSKQVSSESDLNIGKGQTSAEKSQSVTQVSSYLPSNVPDPELSILENSTSDTEDNFPGKLCVPNQYKDISDLVMSKLPGYTM